jgi:hypothetical protein
MNETLHDLLSIALNLKEVDKDDIANKFSLIYKNERINIPIKLYEDKYGNRFYRDKYGFHTVNQLICTNDSILNRLERINNKQIVFKKYTELLNDILSKKTKRMIRIFLNSNHLTCEEKLDHISNYIKSK